MPRLLLAFGWILVASGALIVGASYWIPPTFIEPLKVALPAGVLLALAGHLFTQARSASDSADKQSKFYLDSCVLAYEEARTLLGDGNNDRVKWIAAGRALVHAAELARRVTEEHHRKVLELHQMKYRVFFHEAIASKPAAFFFGAKDTSVSIDEAAKESTQAETHDGRISTSTVREISPKSIYAVWEAAQWPKAYQDPLGKDFTAAEQGSLLLLFQGVQEFLEHRTQWHSASGKLFPRGKSDG